MKFDTQEHSDPDVNLTPLIDVIFLLLIFFMVSTTFKTEESQIHLDLPTATGVAAQKTSNEIHIDIDKHGVYIVNGRTLVKHDVATLTNAVTLTKNRLGEKYKTPPNVIISSDKNTPYQAVMTAIDSVRKSNLSKIGLQVRQDKEDL